VTEGALVAGLAAEGTVAPSDPVPVSTWSNGPGDRYAAHRHDYDKVLLATRGSIVFELAEATQEVELQAGDRLDLPAGTLHGAHVGRHGVSCAEAHLPAGVLGESPRRRTGWLSGRQTAGRPTS